MKRLILFILLIVSTDIMAQSNQERYWFYRKRFRDYSVNIGEGAGKSLPISERNLWNSYGISSPLWRTTTATVNNPLIFQALESIETDAKLDNQNHKTSVNINGIYVWLPNNPLLPTIPGGLNGSWVLVTEEQITITTTEGTKYADIRLYAGESIKLKSGFRAKSGSKFRAKLKDFSCGIESSSPLSLYSDEAMITAVDSLHWNPMKPRFNDKNYKDDFNSNIAIKESNNKPKSKITISPNPFSEKLTINSPYDYIVNISIYTNTGNKVMDLATESSKVTIETDKFNNGIYIISIETKNGQFINQKIINE